MIQYRPIQDWLPHRQSYLEEMLRHDGRQGLGTQRCDDCHNDMAEYICQDCAHRRQYCKSCIVENHRYLPLHRIQVSWKLNSGVHVLTVCSAGLELSISTQLYNNWV